jgi:hypothetical protein
LMKYGSQTVSSWPINLLVGTEKTSVGKNMSADVWISRLIGLFYHLRSNSSRVSCLVSLTKQKIMNQATRLRPA